VKEIETSVERKQEDLNGAIAEKEQQEQNIEEIQENIEEQKTRISEKQNELEEAEEYRKQVSNQKSFIEKAQEKYETIADLERDMNSLQEDIEHAKERWDDVVERIDELEDKLNDLEAKLGDTDIEELRKEKTQMKENISQLESLIEDLEQQVRELERERTKIKGELDQISDLKERIERGERREQWGDNLYDELQQVKTTYEEVKANLRKQNIALLEKHVNNLFDELYQNENYDKIEIGENYEMLLERSTGEIMSPRLTSGGEGAILNLALRAAIYRLVAEKEARAGQLPPFILDEPTDGLDSTHIRELSELIELIRQWDVPQVFLVSHEDELFDAAENEIYVEMDPATETSQTEVRITSGAAPTPVEGDD
jgi:DNA sulfur modification protein DndD